jgi:hypothetical protein
MIEIINFGIQNNTNGIVPLSLFGNNADPMDNANATTQYSWNLSGFSITNENTILIQYRAINNTIFSLATINFGGTSLQDVCNALNTLNLGSFFITTSGGNTFINNYNQNVVFSLLTIYNPTTSTSLSYSFSFSGVGLQAEVFKNAISQVVANSPSFTSGNINVVGGDAILFNVTLSGNTKGTNYFVFNATTNTYLVNQTTTSGIDVGYPFTIVANNTYIIGMQN